MIRLGWKYGPEITNRAAGWRFGIKYNYDWTPWELDGEKPKWFGILRKRGAVADMTCIALAVIGIAWGRRRPHQGENKQGE